MSQTGSCKIGCTVKEKTNFCFCFNMQEAVHLLQQAQVIEDALFKAAQLSPAPPSQVPLPPCLLARMPTTITLTHRPFRLKTHKQVAFFAVFAKSFGAGVALGMNSTSMELEGSGVQHSLGTRVTVAGTTSTHTSMPPCFHCHLHASTSSCSALVSYCARVAGIEHYRYIYDIVHVFLGRHVQTEMFVRNT